MKRLWTFLSVVTAMLCLHSTIEAAETYPSKNITIVVSLAAGTGMDALTRIYADKLSQALASR